LVLFKLSVHVGRHSHIHYTVFIDWKGGQSENQQL